VVAPKGVQLQWVTEMAGRFGERFVLVGPGGVPLDAGIDPWRSFDQVVCSLDAIKPVRTRAGWSPQRLAEHNARRARAMVEAGWDLVVIDEAHHVAGSSDDVARHLLGRDLAAAAPRLLLLSATPHSGKSEAFARLLGLLYDGFAPGRAMTRAEVAPLVVRTEKRNATDAEGRPLFRPRTTRLVTVPYGRRQVERALYEAVTDYVRHGYRRSRAEGRPAIGFLVALMQRLVSSSTAAILAALERRLVAVAFEGAQLQLFTEYPEEWSELTGEEQQATVAAAQGAAWAGERSEVELLVSLARKAAASGIDAKARHLLELLGLLVQEEGDVGAKAVVFTEFVATQAMLLAVLAGAGIASVAINGQMSISERQEAQGAFHDDARVLVSTDAGGEGINLQFAHVVVNYDLPWSPTRIEQRIGRVDRIGQQCEVVAHNLVLEASIDARVLAVLEGKLAVILAELGADKAGDILASADVGVDQLYEAAITDPAKVPVVMEALDRQARQAVREAASVRDLFGPASTAPPPPNTAQLGRWLALAEGAWRSLDRSSTDTPVKLPEVLPGEPVPRLAGSVPGWWTMWETNVGADRSAFALFLTDAGAMRPDLAERQWVALAEPGEHVEPLLALADGVRRAESPTLDNETFDRLREAAVDHGYRDPDGVPPSLVLRLAVRVEPIPPHQAAR
ncbi:MAG: DEAD/DEAH box helicase, partial [Acidimicrobiales bacterium]